LKKVAQQYLIEEELRARKLTNIASVVLFFLIIAMGFGYYFSTAYDRLHWRLWLFAPTFIIPIILNTAGLYKLSRFILSLIPVVIVMSLSIMLKSSAILAHDIDPVNYFDVRIVLLNAAIIPLILFSLNEKRYLIAALAPSFISLAFFDVIHNLLNVGYYQSGLKSPDYYFSANMFTLVTLTFITAILVQLKKQVQNSDYRQISENERTRSYLSELVKISNSPNVNDGFVDEAKKEILESVKNSLHVSRVSIWNFDDENDSISCEYLLENGKIDCPGTVLHAKDYPTYFVELKYQQLIIARDARNDPKTEEFKENYLEPLNIYSLMDAPFLRKRKLGGVICCEHQGEFKEWGAAESLFLKALGDFLSYTIIVNERLKQSKLMQEKNEEITQINENLEAIVQERTKELKQKNRQLTEYAFINAHILRAPIARVNGLFNIFKMENGSNTKDPDIMNYMQGSIDELNDITSKINRAIEDNGMIDRSELTDNQ